MKLPLEVLLILFCIFNGFNCQNQAPSGAPVIIDARPRSISIVYLQWTPPDKSTWNAPLQGYVINYRPAGYPPTTARKITIRNPNITGWYVDQLMIFQEYQFAIAAYNAYGTGVYTDDITVKTKEGLPVEPPGQLRGQTVSSTAIRLTWQPPNPQHINGVNRGYKIDLKTSDGNVSRVVVSANASGDALREQSTTLTGLRQYHSYEITVLCFTTIGDGPTSSPIRLQTYEGVPTEVRNLSVDSILDTSLQVKWNPPKMANGVIRGYRLLYRRNQTQEIPHYVQLSPDVLIYRLNKLYPSTAYAISVQARTSVGFGNQQYIYATTAEKTEESGPEGYKLSKEIFHYPGSSRIFIPCNATGNPSPTYVWRQYVNGKWIALRTDTRYQTNNGGLEITQPSVTKDEGIYQCIARNKYGWIVSLFATVTFAHMGDFPSSQRERVEATAFIGSGLECNPPRHHPDLSYLWYKFSIRNIIRPDARVFPSRGGRLYISSVRVEDEGDYFCMIRFPNQTNSTIKTSMPIPLIVRPAAFKEYPPEIAYDFPKIYPSSPKRGDNVRLECVSWGTTPLEYIWRWNTDAIPAEAVLEDQGRVVFLSGVQMKHQGRYECTAIGVRNQNDSRGITLTLNSVPYFTSELQDQHTDIGNDVAMYCEADGRPAVQYAWFINATRYDQLPAPSRERVTVKENLLSIRNATYIDSGMYQCVASNVLSKGTITTAQLFVFKNNQPKFEKDIYRAGVSTHAPIDTFIVRLQAVDEDLGPAGIVSYFLSTSSPLFNIDSTSGSVYTRAPLSDGVYEFTVIAVDSGTPELSTSVPLILMVQVRNDHAPKFGQVSYRFKVAEDAEIQTFIGQITATDGDIGSSLTYSIPKNHGLPFTMDSNGTIFTSLKLDRELRSRYLFVVDAIDNGEPPRTATSDVLMEITDVNDHYPVFRLSPYQVHTTAGSPIGTHIVRIQADDFDAGMNGKVSYRIWNGPSMFEIDRSTGVITTREELLNNRPFFVFTVVASDGGNPSNENSTYVNVTVLQGNQRLAFTEPAFWFSIREEMPRNYIIGKTAIRDNRTATFRIFGNNAGHFEIGINSGVVASTSSFDRELKEVYNFFVEAKDTSGRATANVTVTILDINDNPPVFQQKVYKVTNISGTEDLPIPVLHVRATDADSGINGQIIYRLTDQSGIFVIGDSGEIVATQSLIYLIYSFNVTARDMGSPPQFSSAVVIIELKKEKNILPKFRWPLYSFRVPEGSPGPLSVEAYPPNNKQLNYRISSAETVPFEINALTGSIRVTGTLDSEKEVLYLFDVIAYVPGRPAEMTVVPVVVSLIDVNDNAPQFSRSSMQVTIPRGKKLGSTILEVKVKDPDRGSNTHITYLLEESDGTFGINGNGAIYVTGPITQNEYTIRVKVKDSASKPLSNNATVNIKVVDTRIKAPQFTQLMYNFEIRENIAFGSVVGRVKVTENNPVVYSRDASNIPFSIDSRSGFMRVTGSIDREERDLYHFNVRATDTGGRSGFAQVTIRIVDVNDNEPQFTQKDGMLKVTLRVGTAPGTNVFLINAKDADLGPNGTVSYALNFPLFSLDRKTGWIRTGAPLRSSGNIVTSISAFDSSQPPTFTRNTLTVEIHESEDENPRPFFDRSSYYFTPEEHVAKGSIIGRVSSSGNPDVRYGVAGKANQVFEIDEKTGDIRTVMTLDRETTDIYQFTVNASMLNGSLYSFCQVTVNVSDVNDNRPIFLQNSYKVTVPESLSVGSDLIQVMAVDSDVEMIGLVSYSLSDSSGKFNINQITGYIQTRAKLSARNYSVTVTAKDSGIPPQSTSTLVTIIAEGLASSDPVFLSPFYNFEVGENKPMGTIAGVVNATASGKLSYRIKEFQEAPFAVDGRNGNIVTMAPLDREEQDVYQFHVMATKGDLMATALVTVTVLDENERPRFPQDNYQTNISKAFSIGSYVTTVYAIDDDLGSNRSTNYTLLKTGTFEVDPNNGMINTKSKLDLDVYKFQVLVTDIGVPPLNSTVNVTVHALSIQTNVPKAPHFKIKAYTINVYENRARNTIIGRVEATVDGNESLTYKILEKVPFSVDASNGAIYTKDILDRETKANYTFKVVAVSRGGQDETNVTVFVLDVNDNAPTFQQSYYRKNVPYNIPMDEIIISVRATDLDEGPNAKIAYKLLNNNGVFHINILSGDIYRRKPIKESTNYRLTVAAEDSGIPRLSAHATVDINVDSPQAGKPVFSQSSYNFSIYETNQTGVVVGQVNATVKDGASITYKSVAILGFPFMVNSSGTIRNIRFLDREQRDRYMFQVEARTGRASTKVNVTVTLRDMNDNHPLFRKTKYEVQIPRDLNLGGMVLSVEALDRDIKRNGMITYSLQNHLGVFAIHPRTGLIQLMANPKQNSYTLQVQARDGGVPPLTGQTTVIVTIGSDVPVNEYAPRFSSVRYTFAVAENKPPNTVVGRVVATDPDGTVASYSINSTVKVPFHIDGGGNIKTTESLDRERNASFMFVVEAKDDGIVPRTAAVNLTIFIQDENDNSPKFDQDVYLENINPETQNILNVSARDADIGNSAKVSFSLLNNPSRTFRIDTKSGVITRVGGLQQDFYSITVLAQDSGVPPRTGMATLNLTVNTGSQNQPVFDKQLYVFWLFEISPVGMMVDKVTATRPGMDIVYSLQFQDRNLPFKVNKTTGALTLTKPLDRERRGRISFRVAATSDDWRTSLAHVTVIVNDTNDNPPMFSRSLYVIRITENGATPREIFQANPKDRDSGRNKLLVDVTISNPGCEVFNASLTNQAVVITLLKPLDYEVTSNISCLLTVRDGGRPSLNSSTILVIQVMNENDNKPEFNSSNVDISIETTNQIGQFVYNATATDLDVEDTIIYSIVSPVTSPFIINSTTGMIKTSSSLSANTRYTLQVQATDGSQSNIMTLTITVTEQSPAFVKDFYGILVSDTTPLTEVILVLEATAPFGSDIKYGISQGNEYKRFGIHTTTGELIVIQPLKDIPANNYYLKVKALDSTTNMSVTTTVLIEVKSSSQHAPKFTKGKHLKSSVRKNDEVGTEVARVKANDPDENFVFFVLMNEEDSVSYSINGETGALRLARNLEAENKTTHMLHVIAYDNGFPTMSSTTTLTVKVEDGKDQIDISDRNRKNFQLKNPEPNARVANARSMLGRKITRPVNFRFDDEVEYFSIDRKSGDIFVGARVPPVNLYELPVVIYDKRLPFIMIKMEILLIVQ